MAKFDLHLPFELRGDQPRGGVVVVVEGQADLLEVVTALEACGGVSHFLDGGQ